MIDRRRPGGWRRIAAVLPVLWPHGRHDACFLRAAAASPPHRPLQDDHESMRLNRIYCEGPLSERRRSARCPRPARITSRAFCGCVKARRSACSTAPARSSAPKSRASTGDACHRATRRADRGRPASRRCKITLVQGVSRSERMDWTLQKATELGVDGDCAGADRAQRRAPRREAGAEEAGALARHRDRRLRAMRARTRFPPCRRRSALRDYLRDCAQGRPAARAEPVRARLARRA